MTYCEMCGMEYRSVRSVHVGGQVLDLCAGCILDLQDSGDLPPDEEEDEE